MIYHTSPMRKYTVSFITHEIRRIFQFEMAAPLSAA